MNPTREFSVLILQLLCPSFFQLHQIPLQLLPELTSWLPQNVSPTFSPNSLMLYPQMDLQLSNLVKESAIIFSHSLVLQFFKAWRLDPEKLASAKAKFSAIEKAGIIRRSNSPWLHMVKEKSGGWCPCGDYRRLNTVTIPNRYPLPNIADFTARVKGSTFFSMLNLQKGYYQVPMAPEGICTTAIITLFSMLEFLRLPLVP